MRRVVWGVLPLLAALIVQPARAQTSPNAFYDLLVSLPEHWRSASLRDTGQMRPPGVTYDPAMDAARVSIPAFATATTLAAALGPTETVITVASSAPPWGTGRVLRIGSEYLTVTSSARPLVFVARGQYGSSAVAHVAGATVEHSTNSLQEQVRIDLGTEDGHTYLAIWDAYWTSSYLGMPRWNHKAFQFSSGGQDGNQIWLEPQANYDPAQCNQPNYVAAAQSRTYNTAGGPADWLLSNGNQYGPGTSAQPLAPRAPYCIATATWTRFYYFLEQRHNNYDPVTVWVTDETRDAVEILHGPMVSVRPTGKTPNVVLRWWLEMNTSEDAYMRPDNRTLVSFVRNFVVLRDVADPKAYLARPLAPPPVIGPTAPTGVQFLE